MNRRARDEQAVFAVRALLVIGLLSVASAFAIVGVAKIAAPDHHVGQLATVTAWPIGAVLALALHVRRRQRTE